MAKIVRTISDDASVVATAIDATDIVSEIEQIHKTSAVVTAALGRLTIAASLMGIGLKGEKDTLTLRMNGNGPTGALIAVADSRGNVKSYVCNPVVEIPLNKYGKLDVAGAVGKEGTLSVVKDLGLKEPYCGQIPIASGEIAEDITQYLYHSEQQPGVCALGVLVDRDRTVRAAGGFILSLLPGADEEVVARVEKDIAALPPVTQMLDSGMSAEDIAAAALKGSFGSVVKVRETGYRCRCSETRVREMLISLGRSELEQLAAEGKEAEVACHFCDKVYHVSIDDVLAMIQE